MPFKNKNEKVLIVEDDKFLLKAYRIKFKKAGFEIFTAKDGSSGFEAAKKKKPSIILLDLMLPKMNGFEFLKKIKKDKKLKNIPVIAISVLGQKIDQEKALLLGAEDYFIKTDYTLDDVIKKVKTFIKKPAKNKHEIK